MKRSSTLILIIAISVCVLVALSIAGWFAINPAEMIIQGEVEATHVLVASKIAGRIEDLKIKKGETVKKGQLLAFIDSPEIRAKMQQAKAAQSAAAAQREKARTGAREEEITAAYNGWLRAKAAADLAEKTFMRIERLHRDGVLPAQKLDEAVAQWEAAKGAEKAAKAAYDMARKGAREEDKESARALADQASGALAEVASYAEEMRVLSPMDGEISGLFPEKGELIGPGSPIAQIVDLNDTWVTFNVREDLLAKIRMATTFEASVPALGNKNIKLKVNYIADMGDFAAKRATKASGDFDLKTFEIRAVPVTVQDGLRPGMSVLVKWDKITGSGK